MSLRRFAHFNSGRADKQKVTFTYTADRDADGKQVVTYGAIACHPVDAKNFSREFGRTESEKRLNAFLAGEEVARHVAGKVVFDAETRLDQIPGLLHDLFKVGQVQHNADLKAARDARIAELEAEQDALSIRFRSISYEIQELQHPHNAFVRKERQDWLDHVAQLDKAASQG
jgi:hypothetical protein